MLFAALQLAGIVQGQGPAASSGSATFTINLGLDELCYVIDFTTARPSSPPTSTMHLQEGIK